MIVHLTQDYVNNNLASPNGKKSIEYVDDQRTGLYIKVTSSGSSCFYYRYKSNQKTVHHRLASTDSITLSEARKRVTQLRAEIASGNDPHEDKTNKGAIVGFQDYALNDYLTFARSYKKSWPKDEGIIRNYLIPLLKNKPISKISRHEIQQLHMRLKEEPHNLSNASCNHVVKCLRFILTTAVQAEIIEHNPLKNFRLYREDNRVENYLSDEELQRLLHVLNTQKGKKIRMTCMVCLFLLSTGSRLNEALSSRWENIDRKNRLWLIPASASKSGKRRSVPLNDTALDVLDQLGTEDDTWLFISHRTGSHLRSIHRGWSSIRKQAGLPHLRIHDLRHNYASMLVNNGVSIYSVSQVLGHSSVIVTQRYAHLSTKTLQDASQNAAKCINDAMAANS